jgi:NADH:ubiquinone oxidoreductase subunit K
MVPLSYILFLSVVLFAIGVYGVLSRKNGFGMLISAEIIINAALLNFVGASASLSSLSGASYALIILVMAVLEAVVFVGMLIAYSKKTSSVLLSKLRRFRG